MSDELVLYQADGNIGVRRRQNPLHSVGADSVVTIANQTSECADIGRRMLAVDDQEIVPTCGGLHEGDWCHKKSECSKRLRAILVARYS